MKKKIKPKQVRKLAQAFVELYIQENLGKDVPNEEGEIKIDGGNVE